MTWIGCEISINAFTLFTTASENVFKLNLKRCFERVKSDPWFVNWLRNSLHISSIDRKFVDNLKITRVP